jgi:hypothetical protein
MKEKYSIKKVFELFEKYGNDEDVINNIEGNVQTIKRNLVAYRTVKNFLNELEAKKEVEDNNTFEKKSAQYWKKKYEELINDSAFDNKFIDEIKKYIKQFKKNEYPEKIIQSNNELILLLSDFHAGEEVNYEEMMGLNEYNSDILKERLNIYYQNLLSNIKLFNLNNKINTCNIWMLGDMVSGFIHDELIQGTSVAEEVILVAEYISELIYKLSEIFFEIKVSGVIGNHGRFCKKPQNKKKFNNLDYLVYKYIEIKCSNLSNVKFNFPKSAYITENIYGYNFLITHGDNISNLAVANPYVALKKIANGVSNTISYNQNEFIHYYIVGHTHQQNVLDKAGGKIIMNGNFVGYNEFAMNKNFEFSEPKQMAFLVSERYGVLNYMEIPCY